MTTGKQKKIIRLLGVGFDAEDGHIRITKGETYDVLMGSAESHEYIRNFIQEIEEEIEKRGLSLDNLTPKEFADLIGSMKQLP